jgi:hypothetical protein
MAQKPDAASRRAQAVGPEVPYCRFADDRERRNALVSRDIRIFACRLVTVVAAVVVVLYGPAGAALATLVRVLFRG